MAEKNMNAKISVEFEETANRQQLSSGDNLPTLFGKIKKFFTDLKSVALSGSYNDLSDKPIVDEVLDVNSENLIQNKAVAGAFEKTRKITETKITTLPTPPTEECDYFVDKGDETFPYAYGNLSIKYGSSTGEYVAVYQTTGNDVKIYRNMYRAGAWSGWKNAADGGNADTVDGKHASDFAPSRNPTIDGDMTMTRSNQTSTIKLFAYADGFRIRATDPDAEAETVNDLIVTPTGIYTWGKLNGAGRAQTNINDGGNADLLDGKHSNEFVNYFTEKITDIDNIVNNHNYTGFPYEGVIDGTVATSIGLDNCWWHIKFLKHVDNNGYGTQIAFPLNNSAYKPKFRDSSGAGWKDWKLLSDGGNADTLDGKHLSEITLGTVNGNKPIVTSIISGNGAIRLNWTPIAGATAYAIVSYADGTYTTVVDNITGTNYTISGLINDQTYHYAVRAKVNGVWSSYTGSDLVSAKPRDEGSAYFAGTITTGATAKTITTGKTPKMAIFLASTTDSSDVILTTTGTLNTSTATFTSTGITIAAQTSGSAVTYKYAVIC